MPLSPRLPAEPQKGAELGRRPPAAGRTGGTPWCCGALRALQFEIVSRAALVRLIGGEWTAPTLADVAQCFDVALATVKTWRAMGMPGTPEHGYPLADVLVWRIRADAETDGRRVIEVTCPVCDG